MGKAVNKLKNQDGIGSFAKEIVLKWKKLLQVPKYEPSSTNMNYQDASSKTDEYDPTQNWEMEKLQRKVTVNTGQSNPVNIFSANFAIYLLHIIQ